MKYLEPMRNRPRPRVSHNSKLPIDRPSAFMLHFYICVCKTMLIKKFPALDTIGPPVPFVKTHTRCFLREAEEEVPHVQNDRCSRGGCLCVVTAGQWGPKGAQKEAKRMRRVPKGNPKLTYVEIDAFKDRSGCQGRCRVPKVPVFGSIPVPFSVRF